MTREYLFAFVFLTWWTNYRFVPDVLYKQLLHELEMPHSNAFCPMQGRTQSHTTGICFSGRYVSLPIWLRRGEC